MSPTRTTPLKWIAGVLIPAVMLGLTACNKAPPDGGSAMMPSGPPPVTVAAAIAREITETDEFSGRFEATQQVELRARVNGYLQAVHFSPGADVKAGDLLFEIDPAPFAARLAEAEASAGNTRAQLDLARLELARQQKMLPDRATSRREFDAAGAAVATLEAALKADEARIRAAKVDLTYTKITAPIAGRMGKDDVTIGNLVRGDAPDSPRLSTLVSMDPIYVSFEADEAAYLKYIGKQPQRALQVAVGLADEQGAPHAARLQFVDNQLDLSSGTVRLRAVLPNPDRRFTPGLYARVQLASGGAARSAVLIQDSAIGTDQTKRFVLVLDKQKNAQYREVTPGRLFNGLRVVESGLAAGEQIVVSGLQRVRPGAPVSPELVAMDAPPPTAAAPAPEAPAESTPAAEPAPAPAAAPYNADWLRTQPSSKFVLQLVGSVDRAAADRFIKRHALQDRAAVLETQREGNLWFVVVYGLYESSGAASTAREQLPAALRKDVQPWPRALKTLLAPAR